ncbi:MAG: hypothetical protein GKR96_11965 [Gammaproteobacteria bacterium]|nr:hypothetical protein [Gammaproteobacteria bacterium]
MKSKLFTGRGGSRNECRRALAVHCIRFNYQRCQAFGETANVLVNLKALEKSDSGKRDSLSALEYRAELKSLTLFSAMVDKS